MQSQNEWKQRKWIERIQTQHIHSIYTAATKFSNNSKQEKKGTKKKKNRKWHCGRQVPYDKSKLENTVQVKSISFFLFVNIFYGYSIFLFVHFFFFSFTNNNLENTYPRTKKILHIILYLVWTFLLFFIVQRKKGKIIYPFLTNKILQDLLTTKKTSSFAFVFAFFA